MAGKIRVLIADDHAIVRDGLRAILSAQADMDVVGEAAHAEEALEKSKELSPDVVVMDLSMPRMGGLEAIRRLRLQAPDTRIVALTMHEDDEYFFQALHAGASGYFIKGGSAAELVSALRLVSQGGVFIYPSMAKKLLGDYLRRATGGAEKDGYDTLTEREKEVLRLVAEGRSNQEIADLLLLSAATVQTHRAHIMAKLGLHSRADLVKYAIRRGIISLNE